MGKVVAFPRSEMISTPPMREQADRPRMLENSTQWSDLFSRIVAGDHQGLADLYDATNKVVFSLALRVVTERDLAEDVVVEVYSQIWENAKSYDPQRGTPLAWLLTITRSRAIDMLRSRGRRQKDEPLEEALDVQADTPSSEDLSEAAERQRWVRRALESLSEDQRQLIELAYFSDLSHSEIAARVGQPLGTVKTRIRLGMLRLREVLAPRAEPVAALNRQQAV